MRFTLSSYITLPFIRCARVRVYYRATANRAVPDDSLGPVTRYRQGSTDLATLCGGRDELTLGESHALPDYSAQ